MAPMIQTTPASIIPTDIQPIISIIQNITGIAAGGLPTWIVTGVIFIIVLAVGIFGKTLYDKWVAQANVAKQNNDIASGTQDNQDVSGVAGGAAGVINQDANAANDSNKPAIPPEPPTT